VVLAYEELTEPERAVWDAIESGALVQLPLGAPANDDWGARMPPVRLRCLRGAGVPGWLIGRREPERRRGGQRSAFSAGLVKGGASQPPHE
jgi:hypothetical protein